MFRGPCIEGHLKEIGNDISELNAYCWVLWGKKKILKHDKKNSAEIWSLFMESSLRDQIPPPISQKLMLHTREITMKAIN